MGPLKSTGPDGFATCFYQKAWDIVWKEVCEAVHDFLNGGLFNARINETYIALIPKINNPTHITDFRPISLCNVLYKFVTPPNQPWLTRWSYWQFTQLSQIVA